MDSEFETPQYEADIQEFFKEGELCCRKHPTRLVKGSSVFLILSKNVFRLRATVNLYMTDNHF